jgi:hypothetical protein
MIDNYNLKYIDLSNTNPSTSPETGVFSLKGGIGITNTTNAISSTNGGTLTTAGGMSFGKRVQFGGRLNCTQSAIQVTCSTTVGQTIPNSTQTLLTAAAFPSPVSITNGLSPPTFSGGQFTINETGMYLFAGSFNWSITVTARQIYILLDGVIVFKGVSGAVATTSLGSIPSQCIFTAVTGQVVTFEAWQNSGSTRDVYASGILSLAKLY